jgi:hypothetical protein
MCLGEAGALLYGRAEPAPPRGGKRGKRPIGERPEMVPTAFLSEGRGLRVRKYGPDGGRGIT